MSQNHRVLPRDGNSGVKPNEVLDLQMDPPPAVAHIKGLPNQQPIPGNIQPVAFGPRNHVVTGNPPPIPPRQTLTAHYRGAVPSGYSAYGMPYNRYPITSGYGGMGYSSSRYGYPYGYPQNCGETNDMDSAFFRLAEESSRPAFQSIESLVNAVGSISMMLDSTYHAIFSSYRAVLGVVESFSRLKNHLAHVLSTLALLRAFQWFIHKVLYLLRLRRDNPSAEAAWSAASSIASGSSGDQSPPQSSMLFLVFVGLAFGAPWLLSRIFNRMVAKSQLAKPVPKDNEVFVYAVALYDFQATHRGELSMRTGQKLLLAPKNQTRMKGWLSVQAEDNSIGVVPINYVRLFKKRPKPLEPALSNDAGPSTVPDAKPESSELSDADVQP